MSISYVPSFRGLEVCGTSVVIYSCPFIVEMGTLKPEGVKTRAGARSPVSIPELFPLAFSGLSGAS